ncbi:hypothetical protein CKA32_006849 [Geitlerinema sp. FC II]|nr:hypothetical protein CKA32_006849 [Geitlerinema sp. FC II]
MVSQYTKNKKNINICIKSMQILHKIRDRTVAQSSSVRQAI